MFKRLILPLVCALTFITGNAHTAESSTDILSVRQSAPIKSSLDENFYVEIEARALQHAHDAWIKTKIPEGASFVKAEPEGRREGDYVIWRFSELKQGESKRFKVWYSASSEGDYHACTTFFAFPFVCTTTHIGRPELNIVKSGPEEVMLGEMVNYQITVSNVGSADANNVMVRDMIPVGMSHNSGDSTMEFEVGKLAPGQSRSFTVPLKADQRGNFCNIAEASASNAPTVSDDACTLVVAKSIEIDKTGPSTQYIGKGATYQIRVTNTGDVTYKDIKVRDVTDRGTKILRAEGGKIKRRSVTWDIDELAPGETRYFEVLITADREGEFCNEACLLDSRGKMIKHDTFCTEWIGHPALLLELIDTEDPLIVGEETTFIIRVTNQGTADEKDINVTTYFPPELDPVQSSGNISGKRVQFETKSILKAGQSVEYRIRAKAVGTGDARTRVELRSRILQEPLNEEESTQVY